MAPDIGQSVSIISPKPAIRWRGRQQDGRLRRNFQGYTTDDTRNLIGFGTSAIGSLPDGYVQNAPATVAYRKALAAGKLATVRGCALTGEDRLRRDIIECLMCNLEVDVAEMCAAHQTSADRFAREFLAIDGLAKDGLVERSGRRIVVLESARAFVRTVCSVFDQYLAPDEARFSRAS